MTNEIQPNTSANKFAEFLMAKTPERRIRIVRKELQRVMGTKGGYAPWYQAFKTPSRRFLQSGLQDLTILENAIADMGARKGSDWKNTDSLNTALAFRQLAN